MDFSSMTSGAVSSSVRVNSMLRDASYIMNEHHCHSSIELFYVESGGCRFLIDDYIYDMHEGDFILVPEMALHYTQFICGPCRRTLVLFPPEDVTADVRPFLPGGERFLNETRLFQVPEAYRDHISNYLRQMSVEEKISDERSPLMLKTLLKGLLLLCSRICVFLSDLPVDIHTTDRQILQAARYISDNYMNSIATNDVARIVGFSPNHLSRKFRQVAGIGLHEYLVFVRLHHAAQELVATSDSITDIALRCGFSSSNYFKDSFKKKFGVTPRQYRKMK